MSEIKIVSATGHEENLKDLTNEQLVSIHNRVETHMDARDLITGQENEFVPKKEWFNSDKDTPHDGSYLCYIKQEQECGNVWKYQRVVQNEMNSWQLEHGEEVVCWSKLDEIPEEYK